MVRPTIQTLMFMTLYVVSLSITYIGGFVANKSMQREPSNDPYPPETYVAYLQRADVMKAIGAQVTYSECPNAPYYKIADTGDDARSFLDSLSSVIQSGVNTLIWAGDAGKVPNLDRNSKNVIANVDSKTGSATTSGLKELSIKLSSAALQILPPLHCRITH